MMRSKPVLLLVFCFLAVALGESNGYYTLAPLTDNPDFGARVVSDLDISSILERKERHEIVSLLKRDLHKFRILLMPRQTFSWKEQIQWGELFGPLYDESSHVNRPKWKGEKDPRIAVFSNHPDFGATNVGTEGWHCDGNVAAVPHKMTMIYGERAIEGGDTLFAPLHEVAVAIEGNDLMQGVHFRSAHMPDVVHPIIYPHPTTGLETMVFGLGSLSGRYMRNGVDMSDEETKEVIELIERTIEEVEPYRHKWTSGDLMLVDNLASAHLATSGTQNQDNGIRVMRRVTVSGTNRPSLRQDIDNFPHRCVDDGSEMMLVSLKGYVDYSGLESAGKFDSVEDAEARCKYALSPLASLATLENPTKAKTATELVEETGEPHWLSAREENGLVTWNTEDANNADMWNRGHPWHVESGQPNDCDGPNSEPCVFVGPNGLWFDFACAPKTAEGTTPGPEITWPDGNRRMHSIFPLCQVPSVDVGKLCHKEPVEHEDELEHPHDEL